MTEVNRFSFDECLAMSRGRSAGESVSDILLREVPGALSVVPAHRENDRNGTDWWVEHSSGRWLSVDVKVRTTDPMTFDPPSDDYAIETWSVVEARKVGWSRDSSKRTDFVLWTWPTGRWALVPFAMLCAITSECWSFWVRKYRTRTQQTSMSNGTRYHSECVYVPRHEIWARIYKRFSGDSVG